MSVTQPQADLGAERREGRIAGIAALVSVAVVFVALLVALTSVQAVDGGAGAAGEAAQFRDFDESRLVAGISVGLRVLGVLLVIVVAQFLFHAIRAREPSTPGYLGWLGTIAPMIIAGLAILGYVAFSAVVSDFLDLPGAMQTNDGAEQVADDNALNRIQQVGQLLGQLVFAAWLGLVCAGAMGVGLLPKFLGYYGYGTAVALVISPFAGEALLLGWLGSIGLLALNAWPGGRPPAWETGRAEALP